MLTVTGIYLFQTCNYELSFRAFPFIRGFVALKQVKQTAFVLSCSQAMGKQQRDSSPHLTAFFRYFGGFCSRYPVEVFVAWLTTFACFLTLGLSGHSFIPNFRHFDGKEGELYHTLTFGTASYVLAISYLYLRCKKLLKKESIALVGMTILHIAVSSLVFLSALLALFGKDWRHIREALPFCFLLIDIKKVNVIEKLALSSSSLEEVRSQIAEGAGRIGPTLTLNTIVEALVILIGAHSGIKSIEVLCIFGVVAVIVNYLVSISFVPAALSLYLELHQGDGNAKPNQRTDLAKEAVHVPNPVVQQVKMIMSLGLVLVHLYLAYVRQKAQITNLRQENLLPKNSLASLFGLLNISTEQIITATLSVILAMKYIFESDHVRTRSKTDGVHSQTPLDDVSSSARKALFQIGEGIQEKVAALVSSATTVSNTTSNDNTKLDDDTDEDILNKIETKAIALHQLENKLTDLTRAVKLRRQVVAKKLKNGSDLSELPYEGYDYSMVIGSCCENVIGYMPIPVGVVGPLLLDGRVFHVPMATVEGCLVASTNRGCRALAASGGVRSCVFADGMTRGPAVRFPSALQAGDMKEWLSDPDNFDKVKKEFDSTSRFARLKKIQCAVAGRLLFLRFQATTGDAMGMNMISKGTERSLAMLHEEFPEMEVISISGNYCTDKKAAAVNWIEGRGKSVVCEAIIPADVVRKVLKTTVSALVEVNINKNLVGSAIAGALGGFNAHASNVVTAVFIATGQDAAQNVGSSQCMTLMEKCGPTQDDLYMSCTMPSLEVGTVGGGTVLPPQAACLEMLGTVGPHDTKPGENAAQLARVIVGTVLAGELSLLSALAAGHLVKSHMKHNRSNIDLTKIAKTCPLP